MCVYQTVRTAVRRVHLTAETRDVWLELATKVHTSTPPLPAASVSIAYLSPYSILSALFTQLFGSKQEKNKHNK